MRRIALVAPAVLGLLASAAHADIMRWDTGKVIPGTQGITLGTGIDLSGWDTGSHTLLKANLSAADLSGANFSNSNLSKARFGSAADLSGANFTGATVGGADLRSTQNFTGAQLASTESFTRHNLKGLLLDGADLSGTDLTKQNLTGADLEACSVTGATFTKANIARADLAGVTGLTSAQLAATSNDAHHNLSKIDFADDDLGGFNFTKINFASATLTDANLQGATFSKNNLAKTNFSDADLRGSTGWIPKKNTITHDTILADGSINGLALGNNETLTIRNDATAVTAKTSATFGGGSTLEFLLQDNWTSPMDFASGVNPTLGGTLDLTFAPGVDPSTLIGDTFQIFNWNTAPSAGNEFTTINTDPGALWDTSNLYTDGTVTVVAVAGNQTPEPASLGVLSAGLLMLLKRRGRRAGDLH